MPSRMRREEATQSGRASVSSTCGCRGDVPGWRCFGEVTSLNRPHFQLPPSPNTLLGGWGAPGSAPDDLPPRLARDRSDVASASRGLRGRRLGTALHGTVQGLGSSSAPTAAEAYALKNMVGDIARTTRTNLGARPAIWVGHDSGSPVAGALVAAARPKRSRGIGVDFHPLLPESIRLAEC